MKIGVKYACYHTLKGSNPREAVAMISSFSNLGLEFLLILLYSQIGKDSIRIMKSRGRVTLIENYY